MNCDFVLIDLNTQLEAVNAYVRGWDQSDILRWMRRYGQVYYVELYDMLSFWSNVGLVTGFWIDDDNQLVIPGRKSRSED